MSEHIGQLQGIVSVEGITTRDFPTRLRGYDRDEVDAFLAVIADEVTHLLGKVSSIDEDKPFEQLGAEAGRLLELAQEAAVAIREEADVELSARRHQFEEETTEAWKEIEARRSELERQGARLLSEAEAQATQTIEEAQRQKDALVAEGEHVRERSNTEAERLRSKGEAEYRVLLQEARRKAEASEREARERANQIRGSAKDEAMEGLQNARREVRRLQEAAASLKQHIETLTAHKEALERNVVSLEQSEE